MAIITLKCKNVIMHFPKITFKPRSKKNDKHKKRQEKSLHDAGQAGSGGVIEALVDAARICFKDGGQ